MPSSISGFDRFRSREIPFAAWLLLAGCTLIAVGVESVARLAMDRSSKIQRRMIDEYRLARSIGTDSTDRSRGHLLVVGNSLLETGVDFERLKESLPRWDARRLIVEQTYYYDWYYGLRRLLRDGARPTAIALMLSTGQWMAGGTRGDYSSQYLFAAVDLPFIVRDLKLRPTEATNLVLANFSKFWGARAELRNFMLGHTLPGVGDLMVASQPIDHRVIRDSAVDSAVSPRMERMRELTNSYGAMLIVLLPPMLNPQDGAAGFKRAAEQSGVAMLRPVASGDFSADMYSDGFHLNADGAARFTERLIVALRDELGSGVLTGRSKEARVEDASRDH